MVLDTLTFSEYFMNYIGHIEHICAGKFWTSQRLTNNDMEDTFYETSCMILDIMTLCEFVQSNVLIEGAGTIRTSQHTTTNHVQL